MLTNDQLAKWDRDSFLHPSTHLAQHARGDTPSRIIKSAEGSFITDRDGNRFLDAFAGLYCVNIGYGRQEVGRSHRGTGAESLPIIQRLCRPRHGGPRSRWPRWFMDRPRPITMSRVYFGLGGSDANETNIKLVLVCTTTSSAGPGGRRRSSRAGGPSHGSGAECPGR